MLVMNIFVLLYLFIFSFSFVLLYDRQPSKCTSLPEKKSSYFGQFVASSYRYGHRLSSFSLAVWCSVAYSCEDILQVLCDKSGEKLLLLAEGLLKHIASHSMHEPEGEFASPQMSSFAQVRNSSGFFLLLKVWFFQLSWCMSLCWNNNPNKMML